MPDRSRAFTLLGALLYLPFGAVEAANLFSRGTATTAVSTNAWVIPLTGPTTTGATWGANISESADKASNKVPIALGGGDQNDSLSTAIAVDAIASAGTSNEQLLVPRGPELPLGNTSLSVQSGGSIIQKASIPTVPFSLTLGYGSTWNGSVILGGYFDKNRIFGEKWTPTEETSGGNTTLLSTGKQSIGTVSIRKFTFQGDVSGDEGSKITPSTPFGNSKAGTVDSNHDAILDFTSDTIALPRTIVAQTSRSLSTLVPVPAELTSSNQCTSTSGTIVLGKPFFQAAIIHVDSGGDIYFNAANRWAFPVSLDVFNKDAMLNVPSQPATATQSATPTATKSSSAALHGLPSPMWMALMAVSALFFTA
ncbi:hypothetical protein PMG11_09709 [Penicillium brasilianum]|uniref:Peptidase A1 domain-containing protein n=1 Tax=Penicillium brasilianum TaxID=104259 RepID=A0A0F7TWX0_PENBI|nr:hypothetical protein PMG11_09709 [Penicillium brasilianum]